MDSWVGGDMTKQSNPKPGCGMVGCVGGWATVVHSDLFLHQGEVRNAETESFGFVAFAEAFDLYRDTAAALTYSDAPHQTPKAAARAVERVARRLAKDNGYEIVEVQSSK